MGRFSKSALIICHGKNALTRQVLSGRVEGVRIVVETVERQNHRTRLSGRNPVPRGKPVAIRGDEDVAREPRRTIVGIEARSAGRNTGRTGT